MSTGIEKRWNGSLLIADGAMGTELLRHALLPPFEILNLTRPELIQEIHASYVNAGADVIYTHTFGANRLRLQSQKCTGSVFEINRAAVQNARFAVTDTHVKIFGNIGPTGLGKDPLLKLSSDELQNNFAEQVQILMEQGVDGLALETFTNLFELKAAVASCESAFTKGFQVIASVSVQPDGTLADGTSISAWVDFLNASPVSMVGVNCGFGPENFAPILKEIYRFSKKPIVLKLNAGLPEMAAKEFAEEMFKLTSPLTLALSLRERGKTYSPLPRGEGARRAGEGGIAIVGGCCGTTPEFITALRQVLQQGHL